MTILIACVVYACSNIPMSLAYTFKESAFKNIKVNVIYLTQWVSIYQLGFGFLMLPLQTIPGLGSANGLTLHESLESLKSGWSCFMHETIECKERNAMGLLITYILVNFAFNLMGLYLVKHGSSVLNAISYSIILPLTVISFTLPFLGQYKEPFNWDTIMGLSVVLLGFTIWRKSSGVDDDDENWTPLSTPTDTPLLTHNVNVVTNTPDIDLTYSPSSIGSGNSTASAKARIVRKAAFKSGGRITPKHRYRTRYIFDPKPQRIQGEGHPFQERTIVLTLPSAEPRHRSYSEGQYNGCIGLSSSL
jgi:hypothetical protein